MGDTHARSVLASYRDSVTGLMEAGEPFGAVEDSIERFVGLNENERAALWLLAFSMRDRRDQLRDARAHLALVG